MAYNKPKTVAKSAAKMSFVAGCPENKRTCQGGNCLNCERTQ